MSRRDAETVVGKMAQYENFFVSFMVAEDLGLQLADENDASLLTDAFVMLLSYAAFSSIPILIFLLGVVGITDIHTLYLSAAGTSLATMTVLGIVKGTISSSNWITSGLEALLLGVLCSGLAFFLGNRLMALCMG
jgi:VIT1/CCC1 family predicted Fe2+/Mn2+ transporter